MSELDEYIDEIKKKISVIPNFNRGPIDKMLKSLSYLDEKERKETRADINSIVDRAYNKHRLSSKNPVLSFPSKEESVGDIQVGYTYAGDIPLYPTMLTMEEAREGIIVVARSGHGKTRLIYGVVGSLVSLGLNFVIWDIKDDHIELAYTYDDILVTNWYDLKFNPLTNAPKGMDLRVWWRKVWEVFCHSFGILIASSSYILEKLEEIHGDRKGLVTFSDLHQFLKSSNEPSKKKGEYLDVAENRIYAVNQALGEVLNCKYGFEVSEIFSQKIVIRLRGLDAPMQGFLIQILLMHEFYSRMYERVRL